MRDLRPVELAWISRAPLRVVTRHWLPASPARVFAELADHQGWPGWFPLMRSATPGPQVSGVGCERVVDILGFGRFAERYLAWQDGARMAFTMTASTSPLMAAMGEDGRLTAEGGGTRLEWTVGAEPSRLGRALARVVVPVTRRLFTQGWRNLEARLRNSAVAA